MHRQVVQVSSLLLNDCTHLLCEHRLFNPLGFHNRGRTDLIETLLQRSEQCGALLEALNAERQRAQIDRRATVIRVTYQQRACQLGTGNRAVIHNQPVNPGPNRLFACLGSVRNQCKKPYALTTADTPSGDCMMNILDVSRAKRIAKKIRRCF